MTMFITKFKKTMTESADSISEYICKDSYDFNLECLLYKKDIVECFGKYNYFL